MPNNIHILIVEDTPKQQKSYSNAIERFNDENKDIKILSDFAEEPEKAMIKLNNIESVYDAAIIDWKFNNSSLKGDYIVKLIKDKLRFPIYIRSGYLGELSDEIMNKQSLFFKCYDRRNKKALELLEEITALAKTGITKILSRKGKLEKQVDKIFWEHLITSMPYWVEKAKEKEVESDLLRYVVAHLQEHLEISEHGVFENYHAPEMYIKPIIKKSENTVFVGDIVKRKSDKTYHIILTPACDLVYSDRRKVKAEYVTLAGIEKLEEGELSKNQRKKLKIDAKQQNNIYYYHYLPKVEGIFDGGYINFQNIHSVALENMLNKDEYEVELCISHAFKKDIIARFSHYYSRQGQPSYV